MSKILLVANTDWYLYNFRQRLIKQLIQQGDQPVLVSPPGPYVKKLEQLGVEHLSWSVGRQSLAPWQELSSIRQLKLIYREQQPDLVHHHTHKAVLYGTLAARSLGIPVVNSIPGLGYVFSSPQLKARLLKPVLEGFYRRSIQSCENQRMIFENQADQQLFIEKHFIPAEKTSLIPSVGVDLTRFEAAPPPETKKPAVAYIGRMLWGKGVGIFAAAARLLKEQRVPCRMVLIGEPDFENPDYIPTLTLEGWVKEGILEWWGWQEDISEVYPKLDIVAMPTQYGEGVPTTLIEAAASRRVLIGSDTPGCREVITHGKTGLLVEAGNYEDLAKKITELVRNPALRNELAENAYLEVHKNFSSEKVNRQTLQVYAQVLTT